MRKGNEFVLVRDIPFSPLRRGRIQEGRREGRKMVACMHEKREEIEIAEDLVYR